MASIDSLYFETKKKIIINFDLSLNQFPGFKKSGIFGTHSAKAGGGEGVGGALHKSSTFYLERRPFSNVSIIEIVLAPTHEISKMQ